MTKDPELRHTQSGTAVVSFSIACDRSFGSGEEKKTDFVGVTAWSKTAEFVCRNFFKGKMILVDGRLETSDYTDRDGNNRTKLFINAKDVYFAGPKSERDGARPGETLNGGYDVNQDTGGSFSDLGDSDDGELPF